VPSRIFYVNVRSESDSCPDKVVVVVVVVVVVPLAAHFLASRAQKQFVGYGTI